MIILLRILFYCDAECQLNRTYRTQLNSNGPLKIINNLRPIIMGLSSLHGRQ